MSADPAAFWALALDCAWKSVGLLLVAGAAALLLRRHSAAARHLVWRLCILALLALPPASAALPGWRVPPPARLPAAAPPVPAVTSSPALPTDGTLAEPREPARVSTGRSRVDLRACVLVFWALGAGVVLLQLLAGLLGLRRLRRECGAAPEPLIAMCVELSRSLRLRRPPLLLVGSAVRIPMTWGWRRPLLVLPAGASEWPEGRLRSALLHELAHVRRADWTFQVLAHLACALYWFNPLVWRAARRLRVEAERACDDVVLSTGVRPSGYACDLLEVLTAMNPTRSSLPATSMAQGSQIEERLRAILDEDRRRSAVSRRFAAGAALLAALILLPLGAARVFATAPAPKAAAPPPPPAVSVPEEKPRPDPVEERLKTELARVAGLEARLTQQQTLLLAAQAQSRAGSSAGNPLLQRLREELAEVEIRIIQLAAEPRPKTREIRRLEALRNALSERLAVEETRERQAADRGVSSRLRATLERQIADLDAEILAMEAQYTHAHVPLARAKARRETLAQRLQHLIEQGITAHPDASEGASAELRAQVRALQAELDAARQRISGLEAARAETQRNTEKDREQQIRALEEQIAHLEIDLRLAEMTYQNVRTAARAGQAPVVEVEAALAKLQHAKLDLDSARRKLRELQPPSR
jgi:beta-lactamase regulating signal transducer with metallopeptidase domain